MLVNFQRLRLTTARTKAFLKPTEFILLILFISIIATFTDTASSMNNSIEAVRIGKVALNPYNLPEYALKTTLRLIISLSISIIFAITYAVLAVKFERLGRLMITMLDILQSVPILGYMSFTIAGFLVLFPGSQLGVEAAALFAIFTSQAWNIAFSLYQSFRNIPEELIEVSKKLGLNNWQRFFKLDLPYATPGLIWNAMLSNSGAWFFIAAAEAIDVGNEDYNLPGIGSYIALAVAAHDMRHILYAIMTMIVTIFIYDQLLFKPLVSWADKFKIESVGGGANTESWLYNILQKSKFVPFLLRPCYWIARILYNIKLPHITVNQRVYDIIWYIFISAIASEVIWLIYHNYEHINYLEISKAFYLGGLTLLRIIILIVIASLIWVPVGIYIGLRPHLVAKSSALIQFLASFPANLLFPIFVFFIQKNNLNPDIWLSPLIIVGTQWYILFNVMAGMSAFSSDLKELCSNFGVKGFLKYRKVIVPAIMPYFVTGAITAAGGAWNASIIAEAVSWGDTKLYAQGLGSYITINTQAGNLDKVAIGICVMSTIVIIFNKLIWSPLYNYAEKITRG